MLAPEFCTILPAAFIVSDLAPDMLPKLPAALIVMSPFSAPAVAVVIVTLLVLSALSIVLQRKVAGDAEGLSVAVILVSVEALDIVRLSGSNSRLPTPPIGACVSTAASKTRLRLPETSTNPPLPPCVPPRAEMLPKARVVSSAHRITFPPSPLIVASAFTTASGAM